MTNQVAYIPEVDVVVEASNIIKQVAIVSPLQKNDNISQRYNAEVFFKREDLQRVRSYKIRGAYNKMQSLSKAHRDKGVICASAGNHAQGVAYACSFLKIKGTIYMPVPTPKQKIKQVEMFGGDYVELVLVGDTFDDAYRIALQDADKKDVVFIHPFNDEKIIEGQATVGLEVIQQTMNPIDYLFIPIGGGGLASGVSAVFRQLSPKTKLIGVEPEGAPAMLESMQQNALVYLDKIDKFVDGAAVHQVGDKTFSICKSLLDEVVTVPEGEVCQTILELYNKDAIVVEPAGAMSVTALEQFKKDIQGKSVVCIISGSNNDITRMAEITERALLSAGLKHYFIIRFPQRAGALRDFVMEVLDSNDDITFFEYAKKTNREQGSAVVCIEIQKPEQLEPLISRMKEKGFFGEYLNDKPTLFEYLI